MTPQSLKHHTRWDPPMHFFVIPVVILNFAFSIWLACRHWPMHRHLLLWWIILSLALMVLAVKTRFNDLKLQDRIIRLEERLRLASVLPPDEAAHIQELSTAQLIALRFAPDSELPALVRKTLTQNLGPNAIKASIVQWRADNERV